MTKLEWIEIENFRGISHLKYEPKQINLLIGRNNSGKTTVLDAIYTNLTGEYDDPRKDYEGFYREFDVKVGADSAKSCSDIHSSELYAFGHPLPSKVQNIVDAQLSAALRSVYAENNFPVQSYLSIYRFLKEKLPISVSSYDDQILIYLDPRDLRHSDSSLREEYRMMIDLIHPSRKSSMVGGSSILNASGHGGNNIFESAIPYEYRMAREDIIPVLRKKINVRHSPKTEIVVRVDDLSKLIGKFLEDDVRILELEKIVKEYGIVPNIERLTQKGVVYSSSDGEMTMIPYLLHGTGFFTLLKLLDVMQDAAGGVLLVEEPENHLHPGYLSVFVEQLMSFAQRLDVQVFMTTHSYDLIEELAHYPENDMESAMIQISRIVNRKGIHELYNYTPEKAFNEMVTLKMDLRGT